MVLTEHKISDYKCLDIRQNMAYHILIKIHIATNHQIKIEVDDYGYHRTKVINLASINVDQEVKSISQEACIIGTSLSSAIRWNQQKQLSLSEYCID